MHSTQREASFPGTCRGLEVKTRSRFHAKSNLSASCVGRGHSVLWPRRMRDNALGGARGVKLHQVQPHCPGVVAARRLGAVHLQCVAGACVAQVSAWQLAVRLTSPGPRGALPGLRGCPDSSCGSVPPPKRAPPSLPEHQPLLSVSDAFLSKRAHVCGLTLAHWRTSQPSRCEVAKASSSVGDFFQCSRRGSSLPGASTGSHSTHAWVRQIHGVCAAF